ncbi:acetate--CoA ligase family protein [Desulfobacula sp.]|uniref:acetate--CoA ligase family protein n=1 Tax=Desulfobacula sp. TaxID=2593537 RepID=UPI002624FE27|nr:acetate--CoA ligase family protein [Desulfobacula sp.]
MEMINALMNKVIKSDREILYPSESDAVLDYYKIPQPKWMTTGNNVEQAVQAAEQIGFPIALKLISPDILHKSDAGCVKLDLNNSPEVEHACHDILEKAAHAHKTPRIEGFLIQEMVKEGHEVIIGLAQDVTFGMIIVFGLGGIFVEILKDVAIRKVPITPADAMDMIEEIKGYKILKGARGKVVANIDLLKDMLLKVSQMGMEQKQITELDFNPVFVDSHRALVADSRIILKG